MIFTYVLIGCICAIIALIGTFLWYAIHNTCKYIRDIYNTICTHQKRGAFGEMCMQKLIQDLLPAHYYSFQHQLSNGKIIDCLLRLPRVGNIPMDAKFPGMNDNNQKLKNFFTTAISAVSAYINPPETCALGAFLFVPTESLFRTLCTDHMDIFSKAREKKVWIVSPTTLMPVLLMINELLQSIHVQTHMQDILTLINQLRETMDNDQSFYKSIKSLQTLIDQRTKIVHVVNKIDQLMNSHHQPQK